MRMGNTENNIEVNDVNEMELLGGGRCCERCERRYQRRFWENSFDLVEGAQKGKDLIAVNLRRKEYYSILIPIDITEIARIDQYLRLLESLEFDRILRRENGQDR